MVRRATPVPRRSHPFFFFLSSTPGRCFSQLFFHGALLRRLPITSSPIETLPLTGPRRAWGGRPRGQWGRSRPSGAALTCSKGRPYGGRPRVPDHVEAYRGRGIRRHVEAEACTCML
jgi:hypothetical protein